MTRLTHFLCVSLLLSLTALTAFAQQPAPAPHGGSMHVKPGGVVFLEQPIEKIFDLSKAQNKPLMVEVYSPNCQHCQEFITVLSDKRVGDLYKQAFVSARLPYEDKATHDWMAKHKVFAPSLPFFVYFTPDGEVMHAANCNPDVEMFLNVSKTAINPTTQGANYPNRYRNGERDANFLIDYGLYAKMTRDTTMNFTVMNELVRAQPAEFYGSQTSYLILFRIMMDVDNPLSQHLINNIALYKKYENPSGNPPPPVAIADGLITAALMSPKASGYSSERVIQLRGMLEKIGVDPLSATGRTVFAEISAYFREKVTAKAVARFDTLITKVPLATPYYVFFANQFNTHSPDLTDAPSVVRWIEKALADAKVTPTEQAELQAERAEAFRRMNQKEGAKEAAKKALQLAQTAKLDTKRFEDLVNKVNAL